MSGRLVLVQTLEAARLLLELKRGALGRGWYLLVVNCVGTVRRVHDQQKVDDLYSHREVAELIVDLLDLLADVLDLVAVGNCVLSWLVKAVVQPDVVAKDETKGDQGVPGHACKVSGTMANTHRHLKGP